MGRRGEHSYSELKEMIISATTKIVVEEGYQKLSTRKIANEIKYTVGTLYNIFSNLDEIIMHVNAETLDDLYKEIISKKSTKGIDLLHEIAASYINYSKENYNLWAMLVDYRVPQETKYPDWYLTKIQKIYEYLGKVLSPHLPEDKAKDLSDIITVLWASIHGICTLSIKGKLDNTGSHSAQILINNLIDNYLIGLGIDKI